MCLPVMRQFPTYRPGQEQYEDDRRRDPERTVEIRVAVKNVEEVCARVESRAAPLQDLGSVDVEVGFVEVQRPEEAFGAALRAASRGRAAVEEGSVGIGRDFGPSLRIFEIWSIVSTWMEL